MSLNRSIFSGMKILLDDQWQEKRAVIVEDKKIKSIVGEEMIKHHLPAQQYQYSKDCYLIPGLIDMHIHGAGGYDVMDADVNALANISSLLAKEGVTGFLATTMTASAEMIEAAMAVLPEAIQQVQGAAILGVHLEGPFIASEKMGAQNGRDVRAPDLELFMRWQALSGDNIRLVTIAPELDQALPFIRALHEIGVIASIGHTNATYAQTVAGIEAGCTYATHLFNAMRALHQREPGPVGAILESDTVSAEMIADGKHLHPAMCALTLKAKGKEQLILVTDAMRGKCMQEGCYDLGGQMVTVKEGQAVLPDGTLAGSVLRLSDAIKNMMQFSHCTLKDAVSMATRNPARKLGLFGSKGSIEVGKDADLVVLDKNIEVKLTMCGGRVVFK